ncbi:hypothetical protein [Kitasatospora paranensis]|uniref:Excreted virulence factor EspC (Type VII ESX diderm) n=1 Tax=Kitasatospora paranensis TaxID=258053 RepID=A0ABW2FXJ0_9ACTN
MSGRISVDPRGLRASAAAARAIGDEFTGPCTSAVTAGRAAADHLAGWAVGAALARHAEAWAPTLARVAERLADTAADLDATAAGHEWNDDAVAETWQPRVPQQGTR